MPSETKMPGSQVKICVTCGIDVAGARRFKAPDGSYYCAPCYAAAIPPETVPPPVLVPADNPPPPTPASERVKPRLYGIVPVIVCPHCWQKSSPEEVLWIAEHIDLIGDRILGAEKYQRFVPARFAVNGQAFDARGIACHELACPRCHLGLPRACVEIEPLFVSIIGGPKTGKSYLLAAMTYESRNVLPSSFALSFNDADAHANQILNGYETKLFHSDDRDQLTGLEKTESEGHLYDETNIGGHVVQLPRPFLFNVRPAATHPHAGQAVRTSRVMCMYDNAGESFLPGSDSLSSRATHHLAMSRVLMFLFDPMQDSQFRERCIEFSEDLQLGKWRTSERQSRILNEAAARVRRYTNLPRDKVHDRPLMVLVAKSDVWGKLIDDEDLISEPVVPSKIAGKPAMVDVARIERVSRKLEALLIRFGSQEVVTAAREFCKHVIFIPVSALGHSPEEAPLPKGGMGLFVKPKNIKPRWAAVPVLYMFARWTKGLASGNLPESRA